MSTTRQWSIKISKLSTSNYTESISTKMHILIWLLACPLGSFAANEVHKTKVVILGAGLTGVTTAKTLAVERNITDFLIVEALPEVGGRLKAASIGGYPSKHTTKSPSFTTEARTNTLQLRSVQTGFKASERIPSGPLPRNTTSRTPTATGHPSTTTPPPVQTLRAP